MERSGISQLSHSSNGIHPPLTANTIRANISIKSDTSSPPEKEPFVSIPLKALSLLCTLDSPTAIYLFMLLWRENTIKKAQCFPLKHAWLLRFGIKRSTAHIALLKLEKAGFIQVHRNGHHTLEVTVLNPSSSKEQCS